MSTSVLVAYASRYGSTQEVAEAVAAVLEEAGLKVDCRPARAVRSVSEFDAVVLGAPLFMLRWHKDAHRFLTLNRDDLLQRPVAVFALGPVHHPHDEQEWRDSQEQLDKELARYPWFKPAALQMFGGKYSPEKLHFPVSWLAGEAPASDIRDWEVIRNWAGSLVKLFEPAAA